LRVLNPEENFMFDIEMFEKLASGRNLLVRADKEDGGLHTFTAQAESVSVGPIKFRNCKTGELIEVDPGDIVDVQIESEPENHEEEQTSYKVGDSMDIVSAEQESPDGTNTSQLVYRGKVVGFLVQLENGAVEQIF
jgi:hypothetical protein